MDRSVWRVTRCKRKDVESWLLNIHYARRLPSVSFAYRFFIGDRNVGCATFGKPATPWLCKGVCSGKFVDKVYECNRVVAEDGLPKNSLSFFCTTMLG